MSCGERLWVAYHARRTLVTFRGLVQLTLVVRRCRNAECALYQVPYRAEEEGAWALPHGEFGLDIITVIGQLRYGEHCSIPEIHQRLVQRGVSIAPRTVTERYEELVALHLADEQRLLERLKQPTGCATSLLSEVERAQDASFLALMFAWRQQGSCSLHGYDAVHGAFMTLPLYTKTREGEGHKPGFGVRNRSSTARSRPVEASSPTGCATSMICEVERA